MLKKPNAKTNLKFDYEDEEQQFKMIGLDQFCGA